jgi:lipoprotein-anchoring transpeptidase ErfK/SrfK
MSIQRLVVIALFAGFGAAEAFAQSSPLNLDKATRVSARAAKAQAQQPLPPTTYMVEPYDSVSSSSSPPNFFEFLFGGLRPPTPQYRNDPILPYERYERDASLGLEPDGSVERPPLDRKFLPQQIGYNGPEKPGTIIIDTPRRHLYLVLGDHQAMRYGIGVGRPGFTWAGVKQVSSKREWPDWTPPEDMLRRRPDLPHFMAGGPKNPLGARAIYLGSSLYRIHGSNEPWSIGQAVSSGCIRMRNEDVIELYERVKVGTKVVVI